MAKPEKDRDIAKPNEDAFRGTFVEAAYTVEQVEQAIEQEERQGLQGQACAFLSEQPAVQDGK